MFEQLDFYCKGGGLRQDVWACEQYIIRGRYPGGDSILVRPTYARFLIPAIEILFTPNSPVYLWGNPFGRPGANRAKKLAEYRHFYV